MQYRRKTSSTVPLVEEVATAVGMMNVVHPYSSNSLKPFKQLIAKDEEAGAIHDVELASNSNGMNSSYL
jgi:hypothetical protein